MGVGVVVESVVLDSTPWGIGTDTGGCGGGGHVGNNPNKYTITGLFVFVNSVTTNNITLCLSVHVYLTVVLTFNRAGITKP